MSITKSQQYVYFQNKARHYSNIQNAKPTFKSQLEKQYRKTIDHASMDKPSSKRLQPHLKQYSRQVENENLIERLVNISRSKRTEVEVQGDYSRLNVLEREFRKKNPHRDSTQRRIEVENEELISRLDKTKPVVGSTSEWYTAYQRQLSCRRNMSRYDHSQKSKGSLHISTSRFMPSHMKSYIFKLDGEEIEEKGQTMKVIPKEKITVLPKLMAGNRSSSGLNSERSQTEIKL